MVDIILFAIFIISASGVFAMISKKTPALFAVPEEQIVLSFAAKPPVVRNAVSAARSFFVRDRYEGAIVLFLEKVLRRIHIRMMKSDAAVTRLLARLQERTRSVSGANPHYWQGLRDWKTAKSQELPSSFSQEEAAGNNMEGIQKIFHPKSNGIERSDGDDDGAKNMTLGQ